MSVFMYICMYVFTYIYLHLIYTIFVILKLNYDDLANDATVTFQKKLGDYL
jgi:hypothetical protein